MAAVNHRLRDPELLIELERAALNSQRARCRTGGGEPVDDSDAYPEFGEPQCQHQARRTCTNDEHMRLLRTFDLADSGKSQVQRAISLWRLPLLDFVQARWFAANQATCATRLRFHRSRRGKPARWLWTEYENRLPCARIAGRPREFHRRSRGSKLNSVLMFLHMSAGNNPRRPLCLSRTD